MDARDPIHELQVVRVVRLLQPNRPFTGSPGARAPRVGDEGSVVNLGPAPDGTMWYTVEAVRPDGYTTWLADFTREEIAPLPDAGP